MQKELKMRNIIISIITCYIPTVCGMDDMLYVDEYDNRTQIQSYTEKQIIPIRKSKKKHKKTNVSTNYQIKTNPIELFSELHNENLIGRLAIPTDDEIIKARNITQKYNLSKWKENIPPLASTDCLFRLGMTLFLIGYKNIGAEMVLYHGETHDDGNCFFNGVIETKNNTNIPTNYDETYIITTQDIIQQLQESENALRTTQQTRFSITQ